MEQAVRADRHKAPVARAPTACIDLTAGPLRAPPAHVADILTANDVRTLCAELGIIQARGLYQHVELRVERIEALLTVKPLFAARWLSRGRCDVTDRHGARAPIGLRMLARSAVGAARSTLCWPFCSVRIRSDLAALSGPRPMTAFGSGPPLYLRCEIAYGIEAGGALGHTAGVINGLTGAGLQPVLAAVERPRSLGGIPFLALQPGTPRWVHAEQTQLAFNRTIVRQVESAWRGPPPRFVYQRHALGCYAGLLLARRLGVPLVLEYNGPETWVARHWGGGLRYATLLRRCEDVVTRHADLVVTVSEVLAEELQTRGVPASRIETIPNGVDPSRFRPDRDVRCLREELGLQGMVVVGFIGTFGPWHGTEVLAAAFHRLLTRAPHWRQRVRLVFVGDGVRRSSVQALVDSLGIADCTLFTGSVPQERGPDFVALFDVAVAPTVPNPDGTEFFGSPTKLFEYMAAGRAIVASALGQVGRLLRDGETALLVPGGDPDTLAAALLRLIEDPALRARLGAGARQEAELRHSQAARTRQLLDALERLQARLSTAAATAAACRGSA